MSTFKNSETGVVVTVADDKDGRFASPLWESADASEKKAPAKRAASSDSK